MQEASSRVIRDGDIVAYDTDLVGAYGMMVDVSRTRIAGDRVPTANQREVHALAVEQVERNTELLTPGRSLTDLSHAAWFPPADTYRHYCCLFHGVGQCDEYPEVFVPAVWDEVGFEDELESGMVMTVEAFVGRRDGGVGAKLENQVLITDAGPELLTRLPLGLA
jgi:Xaa-Pro aminopeptidase